MLRRFRPRKKKPGSDLVESDFVDLTKIADESSSMRITTGTDHSSERETKESTKKKTVRKYPTNNSKKGNNSSMTISSEEDSSDQDSAPIKFRVMGASAVGEVGLKCLRLLQEERKNSSDLNGVASGKIRKRITKVMKMIDTLTYKAKAIGDPAFIRVKNRELEAQVGKLKLQEV